MWFPVFLEYKPFSVIILAKPLKRHSEQVMKCTDGTLPGLFTRIIGYIPVLSDCVLVATPTFEIRSDPGVVTWNLAHEFVQELRGRHRGRSFPCRSFLWRCQAGTDKHKHWSVVMLIEKQRDEREVSEDTLMCLGLSCSVSHPKHWRSLNPH